MTTVNANREARLGDHADTEVVFTKGAPDVLLDRCRSERVGERPRPHADRRAEIADRSTARRRALRTLAVAYRPVPMASRLPSEAGVGS